VQGDKDALTQDHAHHRRLGERDAGPFTGLVAGAEAGDLDGGQPRHRLGIGAQAGSWRGRLGYVMASKFALVSGWRTPAFLAQAIRAWRQARRSPGVLGVTLRAQPLRLSYWTLSAWTGQDALDAFARAEPHRTIMRRVRPWAKTATFRFWTADAAQLSPDRLWAEAERRISGPED